MTQKELFDACVEEAKAAGWQSTGPEETIKGAKYTGDLEYWFLIRVFQIPGEDGSGPRLATETSGLGQKHKTEEEAWRAHFLRQANKLIRASHVPEDNDTQGETATSVSSGE